MKVQTGVVRTNCMDNLDRTNVIQGALAKWTLNRQLQAVGILPPNASIDDYESTSKDFRERKTFMELLCALSLKIIPQSGLITPISLLKPMPAQVHSSRTSRGQTSAQDKAL